MLFSPIHLAVTLMSLALFNQVASSYFADGNSTITTTIYGVATTTASASGSVITLGAPTKQPISKSASTTTTLTTTTRTEPLSYFTACRNKVIIYFVECLAPVLYYFLLVTIELFKFLNKYLEAIATPWSFGWWANQLVSGMIAKYVIKLVLWVVWPRGLDFM